MRNIYNQLVLFPKILKLYRNPFLYYGDKLGLFKENAVITVVLRNGVKLKLHAGNSDINGITEIFLSEGYKKFFKEIKNEGIFIDIGANIGTLSVLIGTAFPNVKVFAFEPNPTILDLLKENIALNNLTHQVTVVPSSVAEKSGTRTLFFEDNHWGGASFLAERRPATREFTVSSVGINDIFGVIGYDHIDYIKSDIEGAEAEVIDALQKESAKKIDMFFIEYHEPHASFEKLKDRLAGFGFELKGQFSVPSSFLMNAKGK